MGYFKVTGVQFAILIDSNGIDDIKTGALNSRFDTPFLNVCSELCPAICNRGVQQ